MQVVHRLGRHDIGFTLIGSGDCYDELVALSHRLGLTDYVTFTGRIPDADVAAILSTADVGISPDPKNPLNDVSTMNKTMEYMAFELPVVAFDLRETRISASDAAVYATPNDVEEMAQVAGRLGRRRTPPALDGAGGAGSNRAGARMGTSSSSLRRRLREACGGFAATRRRDGLTLTCVASPVHTSRLTGARRR